MLLNRVRDPALGELGEIDRHDDARQPAAEQLTLHIAGEIPAITRLPDLRPPIKGVKNAVRGLTTGPTLALHGLKGDRCDHRRSSVFWTPARGYLIQLSYAGNPDCVTLHSLCRL
jgi:hypothetical protein